MDISIRKAEVEDMEAVRSLYPHLLSEDDPAPEPSVLQKIWEKFISNPAMTCFLVEVESQPVGTVCMIIVPNLTRGGRPYAFIENVVVHSEFQKRGIGRKMMEHAIRVAREAECYKIFLLTGVDNENQGFYEHLGFRRDLKVGFELRMR
jgi:ribosomal protein S18 acetylase RimI-like enzyme